MSHNALESPHIDINYSTPKSKGCSYDGVDVRCKEAIEHGIQQGQCAKQAASAILKVVCEGPKDGLCQARITGQLLDAEGVELCPIDTTAGELAILSQLNQLSDLEQ